MRDIVNSVSVLAFAVRDESPINCGLIQFAVSVGMLTRFRNGAVQRALNQTRHERECGASRRVEFIDRPHQFGMDVGEQFALALVMARFMKPD